MRSVLLFLMIFICDAEAQNMTQFKNGLKFETPITFKTADQLFRVPAGYLENERNPNTIVDLNHNDHNGRQYHFGFNFLFWVNDQAFVQNDGRHGFNYEKNPGTYNIYEKLEFNSKGKQVLNYAVHVERFGIYSLTQHQKEILVMNPSHQFGIYDELSALRKIPIIKNQKDVKFFKQLIELDNLETSLTSKAFTLRDYDNLMGVIKCLPERRAVKSRCTGIFYSEIDKLGFSVKFPESQLFEWRRIAEAVIKLGNKWKVKG